MPSISQQVSTELALGHSSSNSQPRYRSKTTVAHVHRELRGGILAIHLPSERWGLGTLHLAAIQSHTSSSPMRTPLLTDGLSLGPASGSQAPAQRCPCWMWLDATHVGPRAQSFVDKPGLFPPLSTPLSYFRGLSFTAACQSLSSGSWEGNENEELRHRAPHCEGNVDSQPMHFNTGELPGKPAGCAWGPGSTALCSSAGLELMPSFPPGSGNCGTLSTTEGGPPANQGAIAPLLICHKHLPTPEWPESWQNYLKSNEKDPSSQKYSSSWCLEYLHFMWILLNVEECLVF